MAVRESLSKHASGPRGTTPAKKYRLGELFGSLSQEKTDLLWNGHTDVFVVALRSFKKFDRLTGFNTNTKNAEIRFGSTKPSDHQ